MHTKTDQSTSREQWNSRLGFMLATVGSAIGLGNIWKFPYITGVYGGSAFIIIYLISIALIGLPVLLAELAIGRKGQKDSVGSFETLAPGKPWFLAGIMGVFAAFIILSFYSVVAGWALSYTAKAISGELFTVSPNQLSGYFNEFISQPLSPILWHFLFLLMVVLIVTRGINKGIEKWNKILMPTLGVILIVLAVRSVTLPGAEKGIEFLLAPDFSAVNAKVILVALGHAFFSLSIGMGTLLTYGSYLSKKENLPKAALGIGVADTLFALIVGLAIFPAVFSFGMDPSSGPGLVFMTLPAIFGQMPFGQLFGIFFFILVVIAALTSAISMLEVPVAYFMRKFAWSRSKATWVAGMIIFLLGIPSSLSMGIWSEFTIFGKVFFDAADFVASNLILPINGLVIALFMGWSLGLRKALQATNFQINSRIGLIWFYLTKFVAPVLIFLVLLNVTGII